MIAWLCLNTTLTFKARPIAKPPRFPYAWTMNTSQTSPWGEPNSLSRRARTAIQPESSCEPLCEAPAKRSRGRPSSYYGGAVELAQTVLRAALGYDEHTGKFHWVAGRNKVPPGAEAGSRQANGYVYIGLNRKLYLAHRLAWLYVHGRWPAAQLDHINGDRADNRIGNLRECTHAENQQNQGSSTNKKSGLPLGVSPLAPSNRSRHRYQAKIQQSGKLHYLGVFPTPELAHAAYLAAKAELHTFQPVPRD